MITGMPAGGTESSWRQSVSQRLQLIVALAFPVGLGALVVWGVLSALTGGHGPTAGWLADAAAVVAWGWLAGRVWTQSATLTADTLLIRNVLDTRRVPLAVISGLHFQRDALRVTATHLPAAITGGATDYHPGHPGLTYTVGAVRLGGAYYSGRYCDADKAADAISAAAGLQPLPPRKVRIGRRLALIMLPAGAASMAAGVVAVTLGEHAHVKYSAFGPLLFYAGSMIFGPGLRATIDHFLRRKPVERRSDR